MDISILIVTKGRPDELEITLNKVKSVVDLSIHEVRVFVDACKKTEAIIPHFPWVQWEISEKNIGASPARNQLYKNAKGSIFIGLDDDAHPINKDFISLTKALFKKNTTTGIITFQEIRGVFLSDIDALKKAERDEIAFFTNDFIGCGFAIQKEVYNKTNGFPMWIDIYGEESCLSIEVLNLGYDILYNNTIIVNHRIDRMKRLDQGRNYFRFEKQLKNMMKYYIVYYRFPMIKIAKLLLHNFKKYALKDKKYFRLFFKSIFVTISEFFYVLKFRKPVQKSARKKVQELKNIKY